MHKIVKGLCQVELLASTPSFATHHRATRGRKASGLRYEKALGIALGEAWKRGQWFRYWDADGRGYAQLDFHRVTSDAVVVLEAKLTWVPEAHSQLELLYRPIVERYWKRPMIGIVVAKRLVPECKGAIAQTLGSAIQAAANGHSVVLHWAGKSPANLRPQEPVPSSLSAPRPTLTPQSLGL